VAHAVAPPDPALGTITRTAQVLDDVRAPPDQSDTATATSQIVP
jgi:hypothetical protein